MKKPILLFACICLCALQTKAQSTINMSDWGTFSNKTEVTYQNNTYESGSYTLSDGSRISYLKKTAALEQEQNNTANSNIAVEIYPNPSNGQFTLEIMSNQNLMMNYEVNILNMLGQVVYKKTLNAKQETIDTQLPKGLYMYKVFGEEGQVGVGKVVVR